MTNVVSLVSKSKAASAEMVIENILAHIAESGDQSILIACADEALNFTTIITNLNNAELSWLLVEATLAAHGSGSTIGDGE